MNSNLRSSFGINFISMVLQLKTIETSNDLNDPDEVLDGLDENINCILCHRCKSYISKGKMPSICVTIFFDTRNFSCIMKICDNLFNLLGQCIKPRNKIKPKLSPFSWIETTHCSLNFGIPLCFHFEWYPSFKFLKRVFCFYLLWSVGAQGRQDWPRSYRSG